MKKDSSNNALKLSFTFDCNGIDWHQAVRVFERAPLGTRDPDVLKRTCENSYLTVFALNGKDLIGMARAISDGVVQSAIYDVVLLPEYQGQGVGKKMLKALLERLPLKSVILYVTPGKEAFYQKLGFKGLHTGMGRFNDNQRMETGGYI